MINQAVNQTLSRTILTSSTVFLVTFILYFCRWRRSARVCIRDDDRRHYRDLQFGVHCGAGAVVVQTPQSVGHPHPPDDGQNRHGKGLNQLKPYRMAHL